MRYDTLNAGSYLVWRLQYADVVTDVRDDGDLILLRLKTGEQVMIYLIERAMTVLDVQNHLRANSRQGIHTLFIFWVDMLLPLDGDTYLIDDWMAALLSVYDDRIYGFEVAGREAYFFPVHFDGSSQLRQVRYGNIVNYAHLSTASVASDSPHLSGTWRIAGFDNSTGFYRDYSSNERHPFRAESTPIAIYYEVLGLHPSAPLRIVKQAYRQLAREYHPDVNRSREANLKMKQINDAYRRIVQYLETD